MSEPYSLFSTSDIPREEYLQFIQKMNGTLYKQYAYYEAKILEGEGSFRIRLNKGEDIKKYTISELEDDERQKLYTLLGGEPKTHMSFDVMGAQESQAVAVKFAAMIAEHYPCIMLSYSNHSYYTTEELIDLRNQGLGFDGFDWKRFNAIFEHDEEETEGQTTDEPPPSRENN